MHARVQGTLTPTHQPHHCWGALVKGLLVLSLYQAKACMMNRLVLSFNILHCHHWQEDGILNRSQLCWYNLVTLLETPPYTTPLSGGHLWKHMGELLSSGGLPIIKIEIQHITCYRCFGSLGMIYSNS